MLMNFVSVHYGDQLCDACKKQVGMEGFLIPEFLSGYRDMHGDFFRDKGRTSCRRENPYRDLHSSRTFWTFQRDKSFLKMEFIKQIVIDPDRIKSRISKKCFGIDKKVLLEKIFQDRYQGFGISRGFVFIGRVGFLFHDNIRMCQKKVFIIESNVPDNPRTIGDDPKFKGIAEMAIDVHLLDGRIGSGMWRQGGISSFVRVIGIVRDNIKATKIP